ncbi:MAG: hypothetical protein GXO35_00470 [Gammaproteobacteria bacterium]|nr:hypothetical protein [Gammaproteobacteria bacterium]
MNFIIETLKDQSIQQGKALAVPLKQALNERIEGLSSDFVQDLSHISLAANYSGGIRVDEVVFLKDNLYRCDYSYDWAIGWTCSGTQEVGRVKEKVRFTVDESGMLTFKFLTFDR